MEQSSVHFCDTVKSTVSESAASTVIGKLVYLVPPTDPISRAPASQIAEGAELGAEDGAEVGDRLGVLLGDALGLAVGEVEGALLGAELGAVVGRALGVVVGLLLGLTLGTAEGAGLGLMSTHVRIRAIAVGPDRITSSSTTSRALMGSERLELGEPTAGETLKLDTEPVLSVARTMTSATTLRSSISLISSTGSTKSKETAPPLSLAFQ